MIRLRRARAVDDCLTDIKALLEAGGVSRKTLERVKDRLITLAAQDGLFPVEDFPAPERDDSLYELHRDPDHRYALYVVSGKNSKKTPPHNHTTWAVICGVRGAELNRVYRRIDDRSRPGRAELALERKFLVRPGNGIAFLPDDIHAIEIDQSSASLFLHLYGMALDHLPERVCYDLERGSYEIFAAHPDILREGSS